MDFFQVYLFSPRLTDSASPMRVLTPDTPLIGPAIELSRGFASIFTPDVYLQNIISGILSPIFIIAFFAIAIYILYRILRSQEEKQNQSQAQGKQLLLFKAKQLALSNYQFKILQGMTDLLKLDPPAQILDDPTLFERSILRFLSYAGKMGENRESIESICKDIIITYEKIYHPVGIRKPLSHIREIEVNTLIAITSPSGKFTVAKIKNVSKNTITITPFALRSEFENFVPGADLRIIFWRAGDAEYEFNSIVISIQTSVIEIDIPSEFSRGTSVPHPLVDLIIPCRIFPKPVIATQKDAFTPVDVDIFKINEYEAVIRSKNKFDHGIAYFIEFIISDFTIKTEISILRERYIADRKIYYINIKFIDLSEAARSVIYEYINEQLFD